MRSKINQKTINKSSKQHNNKKSKTSISYCNLQYNRAFAYVMLTQHNIKNEYKTIQKSLLKTTPHSDLIFTPFRPPKSTQNPFKIHPKSIQNLTNRIRTHHIMSHDITSHHITTHHKMSRNVTRPLFNSMEPPPMAPTPSI